MLVAGGPGVRCATLAWPEAGLLLSVHLSVHWGAVGSADVNRLLDRCEQAVGRVGPAEPGACSWLRVPRGLPAVRSAAVLLELSPGDLERRCVVSEWLCPGSLERL